MPVTETIWWFRVSTFRHVIVSPATMLTVWGEKAARLICTALVAASASEPPRSKARTARNDQNAFHEPVVSARRRGDSCRRPEFTQPEPELTDPEQERSSPAGRASSAPASCSGWRRRAGRCVAAGRRDGDLARADEARALVERAASPSSAGSTCVVNAAGAGFEPAAFEDVSEAEVDAALGATVKGSFFVTQAAAPHLRASRGPRRDGRGRGRLPAVAVVRRPLRGQGGAGDAHARARAGARAGGARVRRRSRARSPSSRSRRSAARPRRRSGGPGRPTTWPRRSSIWPVRRSSPARRSSSTAAACSNPGGTAVA